VVAVTTAELAWLAGLLEGEGCFFVHTDKRRHPQGNRCPIVHLNMTDGDIVRRAATITGVGRVGGPYARKSRPHHKPYWQWQVWKKADALWLMKELYPYMGERRQVKIGEILNEFKEEPALA